MFGDSDDSEDAAGRVVTFSARPPTTTKYPRAVPKPPGETPEAEEADGTAGEHEEAGYGHGV